MILRKTPAALCPFCPIGPGLAHFGPTSPRSRRQIIRGYATANHDRKDSSSCWPTSANPTPYEIFNQAKGAPYCKNRFYDLVKLYHPDRHAHNSDDGIPHLTKLERYRLVVAANSILSDPERRRLYDRYGAGWDGESEMRNSYRAADRAWRNEPGNASMNATWEDWERWYQERDGKKQEPIYVSNGGFVGIIALFALIGGWGHLSRAGHHSADLLDMRDQKHASISKEMRQRQSVSANLSKEDRVQHFLRQREGWGYDVPGGEGLEKPGVSPR